ncbi:MAG TPA: DUF4440 domain-containing protein [Candidatus Sulfotelmatobacter sp.]|nr:DUF4440 domain-containing protein [Candidatus Sulfotelmatobacter sp.]
MRNLEMEELYRRLEPELRRTKPNPEAIAAALEAAHRLTTESDAEFSAEDVASEFLGDADPELCRACGHRNRPGHKFCAMCGVRIGVSRVSAPGQDASHEHEPEDSPESQSPAGTHHYHHHYHHHYFPAGYESGQIRTGGGESPREEKARPNLALRGDMNRAEAGVRRITQEWAVACNTKHLDDLLELYAADALVLRSNHPPVRGAAAVREFFFVALEAGLGEVEFEPMRVEVVGDLAYEAGRCKALVPGATGKRREERGKYLWVCARQSNGEWKLTADCWSSDLSLTLLESEVPAGTAIKTNQPRKP